MNDAARFPDGEAGFPVLEKDRDNTCNFFLGNVYCDCESDLVIAKVS